MTCFTAKWKSTLVMMLMRSCAAPYAGDSDYVQVVIKSHLETTFARIVGIPKMHNTVQAVALAKSSINGAPFDGAAVVGLNPLAERKAATIAVLIPATAVPPHGTLQAAVYFRMDVPSLRIPVP